MSELPTSINPPRLVKAVLCGIERRALFEITEGPRKGEVVFIRCGGEQDGNDVANLTRYFISRRDVIAKARELATALSAYLCAMDTDATDHKVIEAAAEVARIWSEAIDLTS